MIAICLRGGYRVSGDMGPTVFLASVWFVMRGIMMDWYAQRAANASALNAYHVVVVVLYPWRRMRGCAQVALRYRHNQLHGKAATPGQIMSTRGYP